MVPGDCHGPKGPRNDSGSFLWLRRFEQSDKLLRFWRAADQVDLFVKQPIPPGFGIAQILKQLLHIPDLGRPAGFPVKGKIEITAMAPEVSPIIMKLCFGGLEECDLAQNGIGDIIVLE